MIAIRLISLLFTLFITSAFNVKADTIFVNSSVYADPQCIQNAINKIKKDNRKPVVIKLQQSNYPLYREHSSRVLYHVSNTTEIEINPNPVKHIAMLLKGLKNVTIDGGGALLVTHGKMTLFVIDECENIVLKNFSVTADDPTVVEMKVIEAKKDFIVTNPHTSARYEIREGKLYWLGHGWELDAGIAQIYDPETNYSLRCTSPMSDLKSVEELSGGLLKLNYEKAPQCKAGDVYQMRDGVRDEVAGLILKSTNITLENVKMHFLGNFGIVGQYSENITYNRLVCEPEWGSGRTCAGFADFVQMSGCRGKIKITDCRFEGAHDDPINIHGTHLTVFDHIGETQISVRFSHPQSFGFEAFFEGDEIELVDANSLLCLQKNKVKSVQRINDLEISLVLKDKIDPKIRAIEKVVVENVRWTPEVEISNCYFSRIPTRGILVTTRRKVEISGNIFYRMPMSAILIANDGRSWYESGPVHDVSIKNNHFIECGSPVINIHPENNVHQGFVHRNIRITGNRFQLKDQRAIYGKSVSGLTVENNLFIDIDKKEAGDANGYIHTDNCEEVVIKNNSVITK